MIVSKLYKCDKFQGHYVVTGIDGKNYLFLSTPFRSLKEKDLREIKHIPAEYLSEEAEPYMYRFYGLSKGDPSATVSVSDLRALAGISRSEFSRRYGIPVRTMEDWESGKRTPPEYVVNLLERVVKEDKQK